MKIFETSMIFMMILQGGDGKPGQNGLPGRAVSCNIFQ